MIVSVKLMYTYHRIHPLPIPHPMEKQLVDEQTIEEKNEPTWDSTIKTLIFAAIIAGIFRSFFFQPFHIPSGSMKNTLLVGDYLFVSKYAYGYNRYSFPLGLPLFKGRIMPGAPQRGDVVVFHMPKLGKDFIKRIIGLPGDKIQLRAGVVYINDAPLQREPLGAYYDEDFKQNVPLFKETLPEGKTISILKWKRYNSANDTEMYEVPAGHYFVMGDNRDNSRDSRYLDEIGFVPAENLVGRAEIIFFSTDGTADWLNPVSWFTALRLDRFFMTIH